MATVKLVWTPGAVRDLEQIHAYIAADAPRYADVVAGRIVQAFERLLDFPQSGRVVPELAREDVRETPSRRLAPRVPTARRPCGHPRHPSRSPPLPGPASQRVTVRRSRCRWQRALGPTSDLRTLAALAMARPARASTVGVRQTMEILVLTDILRPVAFALVVLNAQPTDDFGAPTLLASS